MNPYLFVAPVSVLLGAAIVPAQSLLLPGDAHLGSTTFQAHVPGAPYWHASAAGGRMLIGYEAPQFVDAGVSGPIAITGLRFRGEDGGHNSGGQTYTGVTVSLYKTTLGIGSIGAVFANAITPAAPNATTLLGTTNLGGVAVAACTGTIPNDDCIVLPLAASLPFDPAADPLGQTHLLIDIRWTGYTAGPGNLQTIGTAIAPVELAQRGVAVGAQSATAISGTVSSSPPIVAVEFTGGGGHATLAPARTEAYGASCGGAASTFYQLFPEGQRFDLAGGGLTLVPDDAVAPTVYTVVGGAGPVDLSQLNAAPSSVQDNALVGHSLGFQFAYPGGSTSAIQACTNGFVWLDASMTSSGAVPTLFEWLGNTQAVPYRARLAPFWHDFVPARNALTHANCGLHVRTDTSGGAGNASCYVTWYAVGDANSPATASGQTVCTMQLALHESSGVVEFRYGAMPELWGGNTIGGFVNGITGFTRGHIGLANSVDPQSRDLSHEVPFDTAVEGAFGNVGLVALASPDAGGPAYGGRMFAGQSLTWSIYNIPANTIVALLAFDLVATRPGLEIPTITAPGCRISTSPAPPLFWETWILPVGTASGLVAAPIPPGWEGTDMYAQAFGIDVFGGPDLVPWASNAIRYTVGLR